MNIILLGACVLVACFGIFTALLGSGKPKLFGAFFGIMLGSGLAIVVCKALGFSLTSIPVAVAMGVASVILLALAIWKEAASLLIISICGGLYIGGGLVYGVMTLFSIQLDWVIGGLAAAILALIFAAQVCAIYVVILLSGLLVFWSAIFIDSKGDGNRAAPWQKGLQDEERQGA